MLRTSVLGVAAALAAAGMLSCSVASAAETTIVSLADLSVGDLVEVTTSKGRYRFEMVDRATGETRARAAYNNKPFSREHRVYLLGCTQGREARAAGMMLVRMHSLRVGQRLELGVDSLDQSARRITAPVESIRVTRRSRDLVAMRR